MEQNMFTMFCFLLKFVLFLQLTNCLNYQFGTDAKTQSEIYERMSKIEAHNQEQDKEIFHLKTKAIEYRSEIDQLRDRLARIETSPRFTNVQTEEILVRQKRPYRLLPSQQLLDRKDADQRKEEDFNVNRFYGPPTSCNELSALGYTLNGYYLVKEIQDNSNKSGIQITYCEFQQIEEKRRIETQIGVVDIKSSSVHFYVKRHGEFSNDNGRYKLIKFTDQILNEGNGFDWNSQCFRAPYPGTYFFSVSGSKDYRRNERVAIFVRLNGKNIGEALSSERTNHGSFSLQLSLKLGVKDKVELVLDSGVVYFVHFTGWLVGQDLLI